MGQYLNPDNLGFASAVNSQIYVDKTGMLDYLNQVIGTEQRYVCVSRPRRFGKSIAARMAAAYYSRGCRSEALFSKYEIAKSRDFKKNLNQYPVIHLDIAELKVTMPKGEDLAVYLQKCVIEELRKEYSLSDKRDEISLPLALAEINERTKDRFIIIIDEWDAVFREDLHNQKVQDAYIDLLRGLFKNAPSKKFLKLAYITGILPVKKYGTESALNNFDEFTMIQAEPLEEYVGFTEREVQTLYQKYQIDFEEAKSWYDGYVLGNHLHIYNPKSVVDSLRRRRISNYWTSTETYESLKTYIGMNYEGLKDAVIAMISGGRIRIDTGTFENDMIHFSSRDDVLTVLIHLGYLAYDVDTEEVYVPNEEVRSAFVRAVKKNKWKKVIQAIEASDFLLKATWS